MNKSSPCRGVISRVVTRVEYRMFLALRAVKPTLTVQPQYSNAPEQSIDDWFLTFLWHGCSPGRGKKRIPFLAAQRNGKRLGTGPQSIRARRSQHGLDLRRVFEQPRQQDGLRRWFRDAGRIPAPRRPSF